MSQIALSLHGIGAPQRQTEPREMRYWLALKTFTHLLDYITQLPDPSSVLITFDDGNLSDVETALPMLLDRQLQATFFIPTARIDTPGSLSTQHIAQISSSGMEIGSHGVAHVVWRDLNDNDLAFELQTSKKRLEETSGRPVTQASIPFGRYNRRIVDALKSAGYARAFTTDGGRSHPSQYLIHRTNLRADMTHSDLQAVVEGKESMLRRTKRHLKTARRRFI